MGCPLIRKRDRMAAINRHFGDFRQAMARTGGYEGSEHRCTPPSGVYSGQTEGHRAPFPDPREVLSAVAPHRHQLRHSATVSHLSA